MKRLTLSAILFCCIFFSLSAYAAEYSLPNAYDFFISRQAEKNDNLPQYIKPDYIRDDYKRVLPDLDNTSLSFFQKYPVEVHLTSTFSYSINANTFNMRDLFFTIGQTYHNDWLQLTGFVTAFGYFDTHDPMSDYGYVKGNAGLYDGGFQAVLFDRILVSARGRAVYDLSTNTFMLMNHFYDTTLDLSENQRNNCHEKSCHFYDTTLDLSENASFYTDIQGWQLPQNMNGPGIRVGFIGKHYEIAYSQGDFMHGIPKSLIAKFNLPNIDLRFLYGHENRNAPASWTNELSSHLVQVSSTFRYPFLNNKLWINAIAEYTWRQNDVREVPLDSVSNDGKHTVDASGSLTPFAPDAHYVRLEQAIEYYMLNIALREIVQVRGDKTVFNLEYAVYGKFQAASSEFTIGFQGSTDGRYYIAGGIKF